MKKIFSILLASMVIGLFSSCILVTPESETTYSFYFFNNTNNDVKDWMLIDKYGNTYSKYDDGYACPIESGEISSIKDIKERDYYLYCIYDEWPGYSTYTSGYFELDGDTTFKLHEKSFYEGKPRSAEVTSE